MKYNFKNLKIWVLSMEITSNIHKICLEFPNKYITNEKTIEIKNKIIEFQKMTTGFISKLEV